MDIRLPQLGEGADSGSVATILVKVGDTIRENDSIIELESDKAVATIPSPAAGKISTIHVNQGDTVKVGQILLSLEAAETATPPTEPATAADQPQAPPPSIAAVPPAGQTPAPSGHHPPVAAPSIRLLARQLGIDLARVPGSARGGRITMADIRAYIDRIQQGAANESAGPDTTAPSPAPATTVQPMDFSQWGEVERKPLSPLRQTIARRMHESWTAIPHVTQFHEADISALTTLSEQLSPAFEKENIRLTLTPLIIKILVRTLQEHPLLNASLDEAKNELVLKKHYHIGIAVDTEHGLIVPVLRDADKKSLLELSRELKTVADKAKQRTVTAEDLRGGSFTISNQGAIGGGHFTPIVNRPEVAILGLGRGCRKPVITGSDKIEPRMILPLCLSYDHRVIDGANAARFIVDLVNGLEHPQDQGLESAP